MRRLHGVGDRPTFAATSNVDIRPSSTSAATIRWSIASSTTAEDFPCEGIVRWRFPPISTTYAMKIARTRSSTQW